jgi:hypothetical protein
MTDRPPLVLPRPGQSLDGILIEAASALGEDSTWDMARRAGVQVGHVSIYMANKDVLAALADEIGLDPSELTERSYPAVDGSMRRTFFGVDVEGRLIEKKKRRFAPVTLARAPYHRAIWQITAFPFCDEEWCFVTDRCSACGEIQRWSRAYGVDICDACGRPLGGEETGFVPEADRMDLRLATGLLHHDPVRRAESMAALPEPIRAGGASKAVAVLCALAGLADPSCRSLVRPQLPDPRLPARSIAAATAQGWRLLTQWPHGPLRLMDDRMAVRRGREGDGNGGATMRFLRMGRQDSVAPGLREAAAELGGIIAERQSDGIDALEFERRTKVGVRHVVAARREGRLSSFLGTNADGALHFLLPEEAAQVARVMSENLSFESVGVRLGLPYRAVEELVASGTLTAESALVDSCETPRLRVPVSDIVELEAEILGRALPADDACVLPLRMAMAAIGGRLKPWSVVVDLLRRGAIEFALRGGTSDPIRDRVLVRQSLLPMLLELPNKYAADDPRFSPLMSKRDAAATLNQNNDCAGRLLAIYPSSYGKTRTVPICELLEVAAERVHLREIAVLQNTTASAIGGHLQVLNVPRDGLRGFDRERISALGLLRPLN